MLNIPGTQTTPSIDMDMLQNILQHQQMELETCEYKEHTTTETDTEIDPDNNFLSSIVKNCNYFTQKQYENSVKSEDNLSIIHFNSRSMYTNFEAIKDYLEHLQLLKPGLTMIKVLIFVLIAMNKDIQTE